MWDESPDLVLIKKEYRPIEGNLMNPLHLTEYAEVTGAEACIVNMLAADHCIGRFLTVECGAHDGLPNALFA
jgi:hypothetical protein